MAQRAPVVMSQEQKRAMLAQRAVGGQAKTASANAALAQQGQLRPMQAPASVSLAAQPVAQPQPLATAALSPQQERARLLAAQAAMLPR